VNNKQQPWWNTGRKKNRKLKEFVNAKHAHEQDEIAKENSHVYNVAIGKLHRAVELNEMRCLSFSSILIEMTSIIYVKNWRDCGLWYYLLVWIGDGTEDDWEDGLGNVYCCLIRRGYMYVSIGFWLCGIPEESESKSSGFWRVTNKN
jgi:arginyl-tRNA--protein-N-Asp/Glu arginylyltransferase